MNQRKFGRTGLRLSELGLGAQQFGWLTNQETSFAILDAYHAAGGNFIQTTTSGEFEAGGTSSRSEEIVGAWLRNCRLDRDRLFLSSRMNFHRPVPGTTAGLAGEVRRHFEESLRRLQINHLDLLVLDWHAALQPLDDLFRVLEDLVRAGKLRYVGAAGFPLWRFMESLGRSARLGGIRLESFQADYSLLERSSFEPHALDLAREHRVALLAQSPLAGGFLTGHYHLPQQPETARLRRLRERYGNVRGLAVLGTLQQIASESGVEPGQVALAWVLACSGVTAPLLGFRSAAQVQDAVAATSLRLGADHFALLEAADRRSSGFLERSQLTTANP
jgi:1-deoxyxylulose-5-phosphate synthase